ncbi:MAG TPA: hypothetical protein VL309_11975 [Vicinamibacterales bacterium]|nr:hypothetical protein [Vicinamibacterales bacterium]
MRSQRSWTIAALLLAVAAVRGQAPESRAAGIYLSDDQAGHPRVVQLHATMMTDVKQKGMAKSMLTQGFSKMESYGVIAGGAATVRTSTDGVTFLFYFDEPSSAQPTLNMENAMHMMSGDTMPAKARSAQEFVLLHLTPANDSRQAQIGTTGRRGSNASSKDAVSIVVGTVSERVFKVQAKERLAPGEYAFVWANGSSGTGIGGQFWDFGVDAP